MFTAWQDIFGRLIERAAEETKMSQADWVLGALRQCETDDVEFERSSLQHPSSRTTA